MPTSSVEPVADVVSLATYWKPKSVLDAGSGFGKYGYLLREYLDVAQGRVNPEEWKTRIDGLDIYGGVHHEAYDEFYHEDIRTAKIGKYDLILLADVIEHMSKKDGYKLIKKLLRRCKHLLITTPIGFMKQEKFWVERNKFEAHLSGWKPEDFKPYKKARVKLYSQVMLVRIDA